MPGAIVIGAGPGIGTSVARRFAREGLPVAVLARSRATVDAPWPPWPTLRAESLGVTADVTDEWALRAALDDAVERLGVPDVLVYNAALIQSDALGDLTRRPAPRRLGRQRRRRHHRGRASRAARWPTRAAARSCSPAACPSPARGDEPVARQGRRARAGRAARPRLRALRRPRRHRHRRRHRGARLGLRPRRDRRGVLAAARPAAGAWEREVLYPGRVRPGADAGSDAAG